MTWFTAGLDAVWGTGATGGTMSGLGSTARDRAWCGSAYVRVLSSRTSPLSATADSPELVTCCSKGERDAIAGETRDDVAEPVSALRPSGPRGDSGHPSRF